MSTSIVILAAGKGTRMKSSLPKVMQPLAGKPLLRHVVESTQALGSGATVIVYGHGAELVQKAFANDGVQWALQAEQKGTGHALRVALEQLPATGKTLVLYGDVPLTQQVTLQAMVDAVSNDHELAIMTLHLNNPQGYGRIVRDAQDNIVAIVEQKDASGEQKKIGEINTGIYCVPNAKLHQWLPQLKNNNSQGEYYLTDIVAMAAAENMTIKAVQPAHAWEVEGINDKLQLAQLERVYQRVQAEHYMRAGVSIIDPARFDIRGTLAHGADVIIEPNVLIEGHVELGDGVYIGPGSQLKNCRIAAGSVIKAYSWIEDSVLGENCEIGPYARLRPGTLLAEQVHIGNFVETKKTQMGKGSKANHLSYLGDTNVGHSTNIGAGTITCNYDGVNKFTTTIGNGVFIGSNNSLVAPVTIADNATTGAGSTITKDIPSETLAIARSKQTIIENWQRPVKKI